MFTLLIAAATSGALATPVVPVTTPLVSDVKAPSATSRVIVCPFTVALAAPVPVTVRVWFLRFTVPLLEPSVILRF